MDTRRAPLHALPADGSRPDDAHHGIVTALRFLCSNVDVVILQASPSGELDRVLVVKLQFGDVVGATPRQAARDET